MKQWPVNVPYERGVERMFDDRPEEALTLLVAALEQQPDRSRIHSNLGKALLSTGRIRDAVSSARRGFELAEPGDLYPLSTLIEILAERSRHREVVALCDKAARQPGWSSVQEHAILAHKCWSLNDLGDAHQTIVLCLWQVEQSTNAELWDVFACALALEDRWGEARRAIWRARELDPDPAYEDHEAAIEEGAEQVASALHDAKCTAVQDPDSWEAHHEFGIALMLSGDLSSAIDAFDHARTLQSKPSTHTPGALLSKWEADCRLALEARSDRP